MWRNGGGVKERATGAEKGKGELVVSSWFGKNGRASLDSARQVFSVRGNISVAGNGCARGQNPRERMRQRVVWFMVGH